ncbi:MAG TPA: hypothetical protein VK361_01055, partial [Rubrobacteraceae bacterium]|nr:hypothetical protein [Rubrobacteraceae bacterium]
MKKLILLVTAALVAMLILVPSVAAQGENVQQTLEQAQASVAAAQEQMQSPDGQAALADAQVRLEEAR